MMVRLLGIGDNTVDIYLIEGMQYPGGNAVNVAVQARRCGAEASYLGCLGSDFLGDLMHDSLRAEGVDISRARRIEGPNSWSRIRHEGNDRCFDGSNSGVRARYDLGAADDAFIAAHDIVHTSVHSALDGEMARIKASARLLSYDYSEHWERPGVAGTLRHVDTAFLSAPGRDTAQCEALLRWCASEGPSVVVLTRGADGACVLARGEISFAPVQRATIVDTLGAGDGFIAGFLVARARGAADAECLRAGAERASIVCASKGGYGHGIPVRAGQAGLDPSNVIHRPQHQTEGTAT